MNTVILETKTPNPFNPLKGDIFQSSHGNLYILGYAFPKWMCIALEDGNHWNGLKSNAEEAIEGLTFYKRNAKITIE